MSIRVCTGSLALLRPLPLTLAAILGCAPSRPNPEAGVAEPPRCVRSEPLTPTTREAQDALVTVRERLPPVNPTPAQRTAGGLAALHDLIARYHAQRSSLPDSLAQLWPLGPPPAAQLDGWGRLFCYHQSGRGYVVGSAGADAEAGTADDVRSAGPCPGTGAVIRVGVAERSR